MVAKQGGLDCSATRLVARTARGICATNSMDRARSVVRMGLRGQHALQVRIYWSDKLFYCIFTFTRPLDLHCVFFLCNVVLISN